VIRNCCGRVKPNLNDLIFMEATQEGALQNIIVIHHTGNYRIPADHMLKGL
jgi:hypothetical protein